MATADRLFTPIPRGEHRRASSFTIHDGQRPGIIARQLNRRLRDTPLQFDVMYFRRPERNADGNWNCRWIERYAVTDATGCRVEDDRVPARRQFNMRYMLSHLQWGNHHPLLKASFRNAFPDMADSPVITHVERLFDVLNLETARRDRLLTDDFFSAAQDLYALVERTTGVVLPAAVNTQVTVIMENAPMVVVRVKPIPSDGPRYHSHNGHERYEKTGDWDQARLQADIDRWSKELRDQINITKSPKYALLQRAVSDLKERTRNDDAGNHWND